MRRSDFTRRILAGLLAVLMITTSIPGTVLADEVKVGDRIISETTDTEPGTEQNGVFEDEKLIDESQISDNSEEGDVNSVNAVDATDANDESIEEGLSEELTDGDLEEVFYRELTDAEEEAKEELTKDADTVEKYEEGVDYVSNEVIYLCDTEEDAKLAAEAYAAETGYIVSVKSFQYGVAVLSIKYTKKVKEKLSPTYQSLNSVEAFVELAADRSNNLPAVYPNYYRELHSVNTDSETSITDPFMKQDDEHFQWYHELINDKFVWSEMKDDGKLETVKNNIDDIAVAVIDTGVGEHTDINVIARKDNYLDSLPEAEKSEYEETYKDKDAVGHGSNVAGIIGNIANTIGGRGIASGVNIVGLKVGNEAGIPDSAILGALNYVIDDTNDTDGNGTTHNIKVVNMSLGSAYYSSAYLASLETLKQLGILVICSAGNDDSQNLNYPGAYDSTLCVAALNSDYKKSAFSNYGTFVDIAAPGGDYSVDTVLSKGKYRDEELWASGSDFNDAYNYKDENDDNVYISMAGTSQATPVVSGVAALIYAQDTNRDADDVEDILKNTAKRINTGYNIGAGCVDAAAALGLDTVVDKPVFVNDDDETETPLTNGQKIATGTKIHVKDRPQDATVYYTLNGKNPDPDNMTATATSILSDGYSIELNGTGKVTLKAMYLRYGVKSQIASMTFTFADDSVEEITISAANGQTPKLETIGGVGNCPVYELSEGKTLNLAATVAPLNVKNKQVTWESDDSSYATVSASGVVKAVSSDPNYEKYVKITATAKDGSGKASYVYVCVRPLAKELRFVWPSDTISINNGSTAVLGSGQNGEINIYPSGASDRVLCTTSNKNVATVEVDSNNKVRVTACENGNAVITITAADGSGAKDTVNVNVVSVADTISLSEPEGFNGLVAGQSFTPVVEFKYYDKIITPDNKNVTWSVESVTTESESYNGRTELITIDDNGKITLSDEWECNSAAFATIKASLPEDVSPVELDVLLFPATESIDLLGSLLKLKVNGCFDIPNYSQGEEGDKQYFLSTSPQNCLQKFTYTSSNKNVAYVTADGKIYGLKPGEANITIATCDGSGIKKTFRVVIHNDVYFNDTTERWNGGLGFKSEKDINVIYPGKTLTYSFFTPKNGSVNKAFAVMFWGKETEESENDYIFETNYLKATNMKVTAKSELADLTEATSEVLYLTELDDNRKGVRDVAAVNLEMYPAGTTSVNLGDDATVRMAIGEKKKLEPTSLPENACQKYYTFASSNNKVATVDKYGNIRAIANGTANITVTAGDGSGKKATCKVTVATPVSEITISSKTGANGIPSSKSLQLIATTNADAVNKAVTWSLRDEDKAYASVNGSGLVSAKSKLSSVQNIEVTATAKDGSGVSATFSINIYPLISKLSVSAGSNSVYVGDTLDITATPEGYDSESGTFDDAEWFTVSSSKTNVATATITSVSNGEATITVTPVAPGSTNITVKANDGSGKSASYAVKVFKYVEEIKVSCKTGVGVVAAGKSVQMVATVTNADASNKAVTWDIDDTAKENAYATITTGGVLKVNNNCPENTEIKVTATAKDGSGVDTEYTVVTSGLISGKVIAARNDKVETSCKLALDGIGSYDTEAEFDIFIGSSSLKYDSTNDNMFANMNNVTQVFYAVSSNADIVSIVEEKTIDGVTIRYPISGSIDTGEESVTPGKLRIQAGTKTGTATVKIYAADSGASASIKVTVVKPMTSLSVYSKNGSYVAAEGTSLNMAASTTPDVTNKGITWSISEGSDYATISKGGVVSVIKGSTEGTKKTVNVKATATDGSDTSAERTITVYPAHSGIKATDEDGNEISKNTISITKGSSVTIRFNELNDANAYQDYIVTYNTGYGRVNYVTKSATGTSVKVIGKKKGTVTVKATAQDGSGKSISVKVNITE